LQINRSRSVEHSELSENEALRLIQESDSEGMRMDIFILIILALAVVYSPLERAQSLSSTSMQNSSPIDLKKLTKKADSGSTQSQLQLGFAYQFGKGVDWDNYQAIRWYNKAANAEDALAQTNLGYLYHIGTGGPTEWKHHLPELKQGVPVCLIY
jgi:TPR repeat protein